MIAGMGFAQMAWKEAQRRAPNWHEEKPCRESAEYNYLGPSAAYYRILHAAQRGFDVLNSERRRGLSLSNIWCV